METLLRIWAEFGALWPFIISAMVFLVSAAAAVHVVLVKRDPRSAIAWMGVIVLAPPVGAFLYFVAGINRIRRRAALKRPYKQLHADHVSAHRYERVAVGTTQHPHLHMGEDEGPSEEPHLNHLARLVGAVEPRNLTHGNRVEPLRGGGVAYPQMLDAIEGAKECIALTTYIFDNDEAGRTFRDALGRAVKRGVEVRVLIDTVGARYTIPPITWSLKKVGVRTARFGRTVLPWRFAYFNLRNHRKVMVVDGTLGFTGGMNIRIGHWLEKNPVHPVQDLHFRMEGPIVRHLMEVFALDWGFTTGEQLSGEPWFKTLEPLDGGDVSARGINDGPDEEFERLTWTLLGACQVAKRTIHIMTPYFIPDAPLLTALNTAALRGVRIKIVLPRDNNLAIVDWASQAYWPNTVRYGVHLYSSQGVFDHTKLMVVDGAWVLLGSANLDPRSLRLNFEFNVECYSKSLGSQLVDLVEDTIHTSKRLTPAMLAERPLPIRLRNGIARLFSPYL